VLNLKTPLLDFAAPKRIILERARERACIIDRVPSSTTPITPISHPRRHLRPPRRRYLLSLSSLLLAARLRSSRTLCSCCHHASLLTADPQPFHAGPWARSDKNLLSHHLWNLEPPTPNEKDFWKSRIPARSGQIGIAQEVAGRAWHDGIPLQEQEECGQGTRD
jgi:hypothetical protein